MVIADQAFFKNFTYRFMVIDEGHRLKNSKSLMGKVLRTMNSENRILLTGTPLQNDLAELWSLVLVFFVYFK